MKILHTADWHIGKRLHAYELAEDFELFINWLEQLLKERQIDVLLVSGDCFDIANPSSAARAQYFESLMQLRSWVKCIILTGGNHDSPSVLNAPRGLMKSLDLEVVGGLPEAIEDALVPLKNDSGEVEVVVAAIPFLRNPDLRNPDLVLTSYEDRVEAMRNGICTVFQKAAEACKTLYPNVPALAMGHLYAAGSESSESERDIQIGNQAAVKASQFDTYFKYIALGHIHKPQRLSASIPTFYSGSPIQLSFSERRDAKRVLLIDTENGWEPESIAIPSFRKLMRIKGDLTKLKNDLNHLEPHEGLTSLLEVELQEDDFQERKIQALEQLVANFECEGYKVVKHRVKFKQAVRETGELFETHEKLEELQPQKVFRAKLAENEYPEEEERDIESAFLELLEQVDQVY